MVFGECESISIWEVILIIAVVLWILTTCIFAILDRPSRRECYEMFSNYMQTNYEDIEVLEYSKDNAKNIKITYDGGSWVTIVTYVKINGVEKLISCNMHDVIGDSGPEPYYTYNIHIYD